MDQLFRHSGSRREKWGEVHYADGSTYGEKTIERAIATTSEFYDSDSSDRMSESDGSSDAERATPQGDTGQNGAYLEEKNRLLTERVTELETTLEQKTDRIAELEADLRELEDALSDRDDRIDRLQTQRETADNSAAQQSLWRLSKEFITKTLK
jgi:putative DNA primase/helicase